MRAKAVCFILVVFTLVLMSFCGAAEPSPQTHVYSIEYKRPVQGTDVSTIDVIFFVRVTAAQAEGFLRTELDRALKLFPPKGDLLANAWFSPTGNEVDESMIPLSDGSTSLVYSKKTAKVLTFKEYNLSLMPKPDKSKLLKVTLDVESEVGDTGRARVKGKTNVPDGMCLMIDVRGKTCKYFAQDKVTVHESRFTSGWFGDGTQPGNRLLPGDYTIEIMSPMASVQPQNVRKIIGEGGELLAGELIQTSEFGPYISFTKEFSVP